MFSSGEELLSYNGQIDIPVSGYPDEGHGRYGKRQRKLRANQFRAFLVFITVLKEMVFQSFEVQAYDYLVKPVDKTSLKRRWSAFMLPCRTPAKTACWCKKGYEGHIIAKDQIIFCEIIDRKIYLNLTSGEVVDYYERIENLETKLDNHFYRCHRSYLINLKHLKGYKNGLPIWIMAKRFLYHGCGAGVLRRCSAIYEEQEFLWGW